MAPFTYILYSICHIVFLSVARGTWTPLTLTRAVRRAGSSGPPPARVQHAHGRKSCHFIWIDWWIQLSGNPALNQKTGDSRSCDSPSGFARNIRRSVRPEHWRPPPLPCYSHPPRGPDHLRTSSPGPSLPPKGELRTVHLHTNKYFSFQVIFYQKIYF